MLRAYSLRPDLYNASPVATPMPQLQRQYSARPPMSSIGAPVANYTHLQSHTSLHHPSQYAAAPQTSGYQTLSSMVSPRGVPSSVVSSVSSSSSPYQHHPTLSRSQTFTGQIQPIHAQAVAAPGTHQSPGQYVRTSDGRLIPSSGYHIQSIVTPRYLPPSSSQSHHFVGARPQPVTQQTPQIQTTVKPEKPPAPATPTEGKSFVETKADQKYTVPNRITPHPTGHPPQKPLQEAPKPQPLQNPKPADLARSQPLSDATVSILGANGKAPGSPVAKVNFIQLGNYLVSKTIGTGGCAIVRLAVHDHSGMQVAIKSFAKTDKVSNGRHIASWNEVQREMQCLRALRHPHIVKMHEVLQTHDEIHLVMEYCSHGDLYTYCVENGLPGEVEIRRMFSQMLSAVEFCHSMGVVHRDLKAENFLVDSNKNLKLGDFGISAVAKDGAFMVSTYLSLPYSAPEMLRHRQYTGFSVDLWSLGILLFFLMSGHFPFKKTEEVELYAEIESGVIDFPAYMSTGFQNLVHGILQVDPSRRLSLAEMRRHPWMSSAPAPLPASSMSVSMDLGIVAEMERRNITTQAELASELQRRTFSSKYATYYLLEEAKKLKLPMFPDRKTLSTILESVL